MPRSNNPFQKVRQENIQTVKKEIARKMPKGYADQDLKANLSMMGFAKEKVLDYLETLELAGHIILTEGDIWKIKT